MSILADTESSRVYAVDIGGSKMLSAVVSADAELDRLRIWSAVPADPRQLLERIAADFEEAAAQFSIGACGVSIPGLTDPEKGLWRHASFSGMRNWAIGPALRDSLGVPIAICNDVDACAHAEIRWGLGKEAQDFAWITLSNGVGGALVLQGAPYLGSSYAAAEIGHMKAVRSGLPCECGGFGCLEQYASGRAIARQYARKKGLDDAPSCAEIAAWARGGDAIAREVFDEAGGHLGNVIADVISLLNLPLIVFGGGVALSFDLLNNTFTQTLAASLYPEANPMPRVEVTPLGYHAALLGAASLAFSTL
jgi:glucokinase